MLYIHPPLAIRTERTREKEQAAATSKHQIHGVGGCRAGSEEGRQEAGEVPELQMDSKTVTAVEQSTGATIADATGAGEGSAMRVKIVLSKQQLKQVAAAVAGGGSFALPPALEQLVSVLKRQHAKKQAAAAAELAVGRRRGRWSPALQSIPEECFS